MIPQKAQRIILLAREAKRLSDRDATILLDFLADVRVTRGLSDERINAYAMAVCRMSRWMPSIVDASATDLYAGIAAFRGPTAKDGETGYSQNTVQMAIVALKLFYLWLIENGYSEIPPQRITRIKAPPVDTKTKTAGEMLSAEDVQAIADACRRSVDRAILWTLYEGGPRVGSITDLRWRQVTFDRHGCVLNLDDKTDRPRYVRLIMAAKPLAAWRADYPGSPTGESPVFISKYGRPFTRDGIATMLRRTAKRAGVEKRVYPHLFRHSRITHLIRENVNESVIKLMMWGNINTQMFDTYAHLTGVDIDAEMLRTYGLAPGSEGQHKKLTPIQCRVCGQVWPVGWRVCECGEILDEDLKKAALDKEKYAQDSDDYKKLLAQLRRDLRIPEE